jgi:hypothetical protein
LVRQIANAEWRLNRAVDLETGLFSERFDHVRKYSSLPLNQPLNASQHSKLLGGVLIRDAGDDSLLSPNSRVTKCASAAGTLPRWRTWKLCGTAAASADRKPVKNPQRKNDETKPMSPLFSSRRFKNKPNQTQFFGVRRADKPKTCALVAHAPGVPRRDSSRRRVEEKANWAL